MSEDHIVIDGTTWSEDSIKMAVALMFVIGLLTGLLVGVTVL